MALGAGLRFAVPEIHNIASTAFSAVVGQQAFGPHGEKYVVFWNEDTISKAAGFNAWHAISTNATNSQFTGFVANDAGSATAGLHWLGIWASSVRSNGLGWVQVGGTMTGDASAGSASADIIGHAFVGSGTSNLFQVTDLSATTGNYGVVWAPQSANSRTVSIIAAGRNFG